MAERDGWVQAQLESIGASRAVPERLLEGVDAGGRRAYLNGRPVNCGTRLLLRLPDERWTAGRLEMEGRRQVLFLYLGSRFERRFEVRTDPESRFVIYDLQEQSVVRCSDRLPPDEDGFAMARWSELEMDCWTWRPAAEEAASGMNAIYAGCEAAVIREVEHCELRWPDENVVVENASPVQLP